MQVFFVSKFVFPFIVVSHSKPLRDLHKNQHFKLSGMHRYTVPQLLDLVYWDLLQHTGTFHKLPVPFPVLSVPECLLAIHYIRAHYVTTWHSPLSFLADYVMLTCLFSQKWNISLTLHPRDNPGIKVSRLSLSTNTHRLQFIVSHNNVG